LQEDFDGPMPKRGISMHWTIADKVGALAYQERVAWNRMAVALIEIGIPLFERLQRQSPTIAKELVQIRRGSSVRLARAIAKATEEATGQLRLDERLALAVPSPVKSKLRQQKQRTGISMSEQVRRSLVGAT
jgi:hypothetical protein